MNLVLWRSGCNVCTKDPENFDEEVKSLVTACRFSYQNAKYIINPALVLNRYLDLSETYSFIILQRLNGPLARNCRWTLLTQLTDRF
jgi:hypothetical protein